MTAAKQKQTASFRKNDARLTVRELTRYAEGWMLDGEIRQLSERTLATRRLMLDKLTWFLTDTKCDECGLLELRQFFVYVGRGHEEGRWGNGQFTKAARSSTVKTYHAYLASLFSWLVAEGLMDASPMDGIPPPTVRADQIQPFSEVQARSLIDAAKRSVSPRRNEAIILFLLDTGVRASELCGLLVRDLDLGGRKAVVTGKGNKTRVVYFGKATTRALWAYLRDEERETEEPLFQADRGRENERGATISTSGLLQLIGHLGKAAKIEAARCSPHTFRHTFSVTFLRNGGNVFTLQQMLGHTELKMTNRYVALAQADIERQHRSYSPVDGMRASRGRK